MVLYYVNSLHLCLCRFAHYCDGVNHDSQDGKGLSTCPVGRWKRRFDGSSPAAELALDGEGVVSVLKADFAKGDRLTSLLAIAYPQQHGVAGELEKIVVGQLRSLLRHPDVIAHTFREVCASSQTGPDAEVLSRLEGLRGRRHQAE